MLDELSTEDTDMLNLEESDSLLQGFSYPDRDGVLQPLEKDEEEWLVKKILSTFDRLEREKQPKVQQWKTTETAIKAAASKTAKGRFYGLVPWGKQSVQTLISHIWGRSLQTPKIFFSVDGTDAQSKENAPIQKENLYQHFKKDRLRQKMDRSLLLHGVPKGVIIGHIGVCEKSRKVHGRKELVSQWRGVQATEAGESEFVDVDQQLYRGATMTVVDPHDFVFDTENHEDWDACFKAYRSYQVYEDIEADPTYSNYEDLREKVLAKSNELGKESGGGGKVTKQAKNKFRKQDQMAGVDETGRLEVIEVHGDFRLKNGTYLRNWTFVIAARKNLIKFETNPLFINPFVKWCYEETEDGWGTSPIDYILSFINAASSLLSSGVTGAKLAINPPWLAEEKQFEQKEQMLTEGKVINYRRNDSLQNTPPQPLQFKYDAPFPFVQLMEGQAEATTAATRQLSGNVTTNDKVQTATEFQGLQVVGNLIIDRVVDLFNEDYKIPVIEKMAMLNAMTYPDETTVPIDNEKGTRDFKQVSPEVYYGNYEYKIEDNKSEMERKQNQREKLDLFVMGLNNPDIQERAKVLELWKELWRDFGYGTPGKYILDDEEYIYEEAKKMRIQMLIQSLAMQAGVGFFPELEQAEAAMQQMMMGDPNVQQQAGAGPAPTAQAVPGAPPSAPSFPGVPGV